MKHFHLLILLFSYTLTAQDFAWFKTIDGAYSAWGDRLKSDEDGSLYFRTQTSYQMVGNSDFHFQDAAYNDSAFIVKYDKNGVFQWIKRFGQIRDFDIVSDKLYVLLPSSVLICDKQGSILKTVACNNPSSVKATATGFYLNEGEYLKQYSSAGASMHAKHYPNAAPGKILAVNSNSLFMVGNYVCDAIIDGHQLDTTCSSNQFAANYYLCGDTLGDIKFTKGTAGGTYKSTLQDARVSVDQQYLISHCMAYDNSTIFVNSLKHQLLWSKSIPPATLHISRVPAVQGWNSSVYAIVNSQHLGNSDSHMQLHKYTNNGTVQELGKGFFDLRAMDLLVNQHGIFITGEIMRPVTIDNQLYTPKTPDGTKFVAKLNPNLTSLAEEQFLLRSRAYPNPFFDRTTITLTDPTAEIKTVELFDMTGKNIQCEYVTSAASVTLLRNNLPAGLYLYKVSLTNGKQAAGKLMAE